MSDHVRFTVTWDGGRVGLTMVPREVAEVCKRFEDLRRIHAEQTELLRALAITDVTRCYQVRQRALAAAEVLSDEEVRAAAARDVPREHAMLRSRLDAVLQRANRLREWRRSAWEPERSGTSRVQRTARFIGERMAQLEVELTAGNLRAALKTMVADELSALTHLAALVDGEQHSYHPQTMGALIRDARASALTRLGRSAGS